MMFNIERRLAKLELASMPPPKKVVRMLAEPLDGATEEARQAYARDLAKARAEADFIIILTALKPLPPDESKLVYVENETTAWLNYFGNQPSERGNQSRLADILQDLNGNVVEVVKEPAR